MLAFEVPQTLSCSFLRPTLFKARPVGQYQTHFDQAVRTTAEPNFKCMLLYSCKLETAVNQGWNSFCLWGSCAIILSLQRDAQGGKIHLSRSGNSSHRAFGIIWATYWSQKSVDAESSLMSQAIYSSIKIPNELHHTFESAPSKTGRCKWPASIFPQSLSYKPEAIVIWQRLV